MSHDIDDLYRVSERGERGRVERRARTERETRERPVARQTDPRHRRPASRFGPHPRRFAARSSSIVRDARGETRGGGRERAPLDSLGV